MFWPATVQQQQQQWKWRLGGTSLQTKYSSLDNYRHYIKFSPVSTHQPGETIIEDNSIFSSTSCQQLHGFSKHVIHASLCNKIKGTRNFLI